MASLTADNLQRTAHGLLKNFESYTTDKTNVPRLENKINFHNRCIEKFNAIKE